MNTENNSQSNTLPLAGIRVVEFTHMVMGPTSGMLLADLSADVGSHNFKSETMKAQGLDKRSKNEL